MHYLTAKTYTLHKLQNVTCFSFCVFLFKRRCAQFTSHIPSGPLMWKVRRREQKRDTNHSANVTHTCLDLWLWMQTSHLFWKFPESPRNWQQPPDTRKWCIMSRKSVVPLFGWSKIGHEGVLPLQHHPPLGLGSIRLWILSYHPDVIPQHFLGLSHSVFLQFDFIHNNWYLFKLVMGIKAACRELNPGTPLHSYSRCSLSVFS